jgi:hypothetical protein
MSAVTITKTHTCLPFSDLDEKTKTKVMEKYYNYNVLHEWWYVIYEYFAEKMYEKGIEVDLNHTYFSLGYSQSDYAAITAKVADIDKFINTLGGFDEKETRLIKFAVNDGYISCIGCTAQHSSTSVNVEWDNPHEYNQSSSSDAYRFAEETLENFAESVDCFFKDATREFYRDLRTDYEYLTSEEGLSESFDANECVFEIGTGKMFHRT